MELAIIGALVVGAVVLLAYAVKRGRGRAGAVESAEADDWASRVGQAAKQAAAPAPPRKHTRLLERSVTFTAGGVFALVLLVLMNLIAFVLFMADSSAIRQAAIGTAWIALNQVAIFCATVGMRRRYWLLQPDDDDPIGSNKNRPAVNRAALFWIALQGARSKCTFNFRVS